MFTTSDNRPVFLELWRIRLPIAGIVSILQRISGLLMVLSIPLAAWLFELALSSPAGFARASAFLDHGLVRLGLLLIVWSLLHHSLAGIRYLLIDFGIGVARRPARYSAWAALVAALLATALVACTGVGA